MMFTRETTLTRVEIIILSSVLLTCSLLASAEKTSTEQTSAEKTKDITQHQCIKPTAANQRLSNTTTINDEPIDPSFYVAANQMEAEALLIDVRETPVQESQGAEVFSNTSGAAEITTLEIKGALKIPLYAIKTKTYLKNESLVLVGDGLDNYRLEQRVKSLQQRGFKKIKILDEGLSGLVGSRYLATEPTSVFKLRLASAEKLLSAAMANRQARENFLFLSLSTNHQQVFKQLKLHSVHLPYTNLAEQTSTSTSNSNEDFFIRLQAAVIAAFEKNPHSRLVLIHDDMALYRQIHNGQYFFDIPNLWFMQGGHQALQQLHDKIIITAAARQRVNTTCAS